MQSDQLATHRSWNMSRIRSKNTKPEILVRKAIHAKGYRFRLHEKKLPGKPDLVLAKHRLVIFVNGCFWHRHQGCRLSTTPKSNTDFWERKFSDNMQRDERNKKKLQALGWRVQVIWECETRDSKLLDLSLKRIFDES